MPDVLPDAAPKGFVSPRRIELGIYWWLGKCFNYYTTETRSALSCKITFPFDEYTILTLTNESCYTKQFIVLLSTSMTY